MPRYVNTSRSAKGLYSTNIRQFLGVDLSNSPAGVSANRSPYAKNMLPDLTGKPVKRTGYFLKYKFGGAINGFSYYLLKNQTFEIVHAGTELCNAQNGEVLFKGLKNQKSTALQLGEKLWFLDGSTLLKIEKNSEGNLTATPAENDAYVPTVTIARAPSGGGTAYESLNLLSGYFKESFLGTAADTVYQLSLDKLDTEGYKVEVLQADGSRKEITNYLFDPPSGRFTFTAAPGVSPVAGQDNVFITAKILDNSQYKNRIYGCSIAVLYDIGGAGSRMFLSGNPDYPNWDWHSAVDDPTYFADMSYSKLGQASAPIVGYSVVGDKLATHKYGEENGRNVYIRSGKLEGAEVLFPIVSTLQGEGAVSKHCFGALATEPLFLTSLGVYAITAQDVSGEKYTQNRSFYINGKLCSEVAEARNLLKLAGENPLEVGSATVYKDFYMLAMGQKIYMLDAGQRAYEQNEPYSTHQYECYMFEDIEAHTLWNHEGVLYYGDKNGNVMQFYTDAQKAASYNDNGKAIDAFWETPDLNGGSFYTAKTFKHLALSLASAGATSAYVKMQHKGRWEDVFFEYGSTRYFSFSQLCFSKLSFSTDNTSKVLNRRIRFKRVDKMRLRIGNNTLNEPFGIYELALEYTQNGRYKS